MNKIGFALIVLSLWLLSACDKPVADELIIKSVDYDYTSTMRKRVDVRVVGDFEIIILENGEESKL